MNPAGYDAWYDTPRGRWIGSNEMALLQRMLAPNSGESLLDVGCDTEWFTRQLAKRADLDVSGIDLNVSWLRHAMEQDCCSTYRAANARSLPFASRSFDRVLSDTALNLIDSWELALREIVRVTRKRFAIGVLNSTRMLWRATVQSKGMGSYHSAIWYAPQRISAALHHVPVRDIRVRSAIFLPSGSRPAVMVEHVLPKILRCGGFLLFSGEAQAW